MIGICLYAKIIFSIINFFALKLYVKGVNFSICFLLIINVSRETFMYMF